MTSDDSPLRDDVDSPSENDDADLRVPVASDYETTDDRFERLLADFYAD